MTDNREWHEKEDEKYSLLYKDGYPEGNPTGLLRRFGYNRELRTCDLGCGRATLNRYFSNYVGVDVSKWIVEKNKQELGGDFYHASLHDLSVIYNREFDLVICADVMEHVPPNQVKSVLCEISKLKADKFAFSISTRPSQALDKQGNQLHLTLWSYDKWAEECSSFFKIVRRINGHDPGGKPWRANLISLELEN